jgi:hypothetical protein
MARPKLGEPIPALYSLPLLRQLKNFTVAAIGHTLNGAPTCTQEQIDARYAICRGCPLHRPDMQNPAVGICTHPECGCTVTREDRFLSKLGWADQDCPLDEWPK